MGRCWASLGSHGRFWNQDFPDEAKRLKSWQRSKQIIYKIWQFEHLEQSSAALFWCNDNFNSTLDLFTADVFIPLAGIMQLHSSAPHRLWHGSVSLEESNCAVPSVDDLSQFLFQGCKIVTLTPFRVFFIFICTSHLWAGLEWKHFKTSSAQHRYIWMMGRTHHSNCRSCEKTVDTIDAVQLLHSDHLPSALPFLQKQSKSKSKAATNRLLEIF